MRLPLPQSLSGQTLAVLACTMLLSHLVGIAVYSFDRGRVVAATEAHDFAERAVGMVDLLRHLPEGWREEVVRESDGRTFHVALDPSPDTPGEDLDEDLSQEIAVLLASQLPEHSREDVRVAFTRTPFVPRGGGEPADGKGERVFLHISFRLAEAGWLNFVGDMAPAGRFWLTPASAYILSILLCVGAAAIWLVVRVTAPLTDFARAADRLGRNLRAEPLPETGPTEVAQAAHAFNAMQERLRRLVENRTLILAALSHDLRTPVTLLRLRAELMRDENEQALLLQTLDEMEQIIGSVLAFTKATLVEETPRRVDLAAMLGSICEDLADAGADIALQVPGPVPLSCRRVALKRALTNLLDNALKYGGEARVRLMHREHTVAIEIDDRGPGIPPEKREAVFMPFSRIDEARGAETGGVGLGLSIAQSVVQGHGGDIELEDGPEGGLRVRVILPR
jgi:signal transduction histidine kinase